MLPPNTHFKCGEVSNPLGVSLGASYESGTQYHLDSKFFRLGSTPPKPRGVDPIKLCLVNLLILGVKIMFKLFRSSQIINNHAKCTISMTNKPYL